MTQTIIPISYFPSTVVFVDDSEDFLLNLTLGLDPNLSFKCYYAAADALHAIHSGFQQNFLDESLTDFSQYETVKHTNQNSMHNEIYNPLRFCEISVIITDYEMPDMNGVEFCKKMETSSIKRILLTGKADESITKAAFDNKLIHYYLPKQSLQLKDELNKAIVNLQLDYFQEMTRMIAHFIPLKSSQILQDPAVIELFNSIKDENQIVEYYMMDSNDRFLMLDADANISTLSIWSNPLEMAKKIEGKIPYWYEYNKNPNIINLQRDKILSYNKYLSIRNQQD